MDADDLLDIFNVDELVRHTANGIVRGIRVIVLTERLPLLAWQSSGPGDLNADT